MRTQRALNAVTGIAPADRGIALAAAVILECDIGSLTVAQEHAEALVFFERASGNVAALARALRFAANPRRATGDLTGAIRLTAEAYEIAARCQLAEHASQACDSCATVFLEQGDLSACDEWLAKAEQWARKISPQYAKRSLCLVRANLCIRRGEVDEAERLLLYDRMSDSPSSIRERLTILEVRCRVLTAKRDVTALRLVAASLESQLSVTRERLFQDSFVSALIDAMHALDRSSEAIEYAAKYSTQWRRGHMPPPQNPADLTA
jgi:hypothetical protein